MDRGSTPSNHDTQSTRVRNRRRRASKLGQSLYCVGGCRKMLSLQHFPIDHIGHCYACVRDRQRASPSDQILQEQLDNSDPPRARRCGRSVRKRHPSELILLASRPAVTHDETRALSFQAASHPIQMLEHIQATGAHTVETSQSQSVQSTPVLYLLLKLGDCYKTRQRQTN